MNLGIESETLEFKKTTSEIEKALNNIASMLNKHGHGTLFFGVSPDGTVTGQQISASSLDDVAKKIIRNSQDWILGSRSGSPEYFRRHVRGNGG